MAQPKLNIKQQKFVNAYLVSGNATQAAIEAGYSENGAHVKGSNLLSIIKVQKAISEGVQEAEERTGIDKDYVLTNLREVLERCMQRAPVMVRQGRTMVQLQDEEGRDVWEFDSRGAIGSLKLLGDHLGLYTKKVEISGELQTPISPELLAGIANKIRRNAK